MQVNLADEWEYVPILSGKTIFQVIIPHFIPLVSSYTPWKHQKTYGTERNQWHEIRKKHRSEVSYSLKGNKITSMTLIILVDSSSCNT